MDKRTIYVAVLVTINAILAIGLSVGTTKAEGDTLGQNWRYCCQQDEEMNDHCCKCCYITHDCDSSSECVPEYDQ